MALTTKKDFAALCGLTTKKISTYQSRGKVEYEENGLIDTRKDLNKSFLVRHSALAEMKDLTVPVVEKPAKAGKSVPVKQQNIEYNPEDANIDNIPFEHPKEGEIMKFTQAERILQHSRAENAQLISELKKMEIQKVRGELIDYVSVKTLISEYSRNLNTEVKNVVESILSLMNTRFSLSNKEAAELRREAFSRINLANEAAIAETKKGLQVITEETLGKVA